MKGDFTSPISKEAGRSRYIGGCRCKDDKLGGSETTIRPFFTRIREMHLFSNIFQTQRLWACRYLVSDKNFKKQKHHSLHFGPPNSACASLMGVLPYRFSISVKSRSPCLCNSTLFSCRTCWRLLTRDSMPAHVQEKSQRGILTPQIPGWKQN